MRRQERKKIRPNYFKHEAMDRSIVNINNNQRRDKSGGVRGGAGAFVCLFHKATLKTTWILTAETQNQTRTRTHTLAHSHKQANSER